MRTGGICAGRHRQHTAIEPCCATACRTKCPWCDARRCCHWHCNGWRGRLGRARGAISMSFGPATRPDRADVGDDRVGLLGVAGVRPSTRECSMIAELQCSLGRRQDRSSHGHDRAQRTAISSGPRTAPETVVVAAPRGGGADACGCTDIFRAASRASRRTRSPTLGAQTIEHDDHELDKSLQVASHHGKMTSRST